MKSNTGSTAKTLAMLLAELPTEILTQIFIPLLQHSQAWSQIWCDPGPNNLVGDFDGLTRREALAPLSAECLQPGLLRVCRRFNRIGTELLYANTLVLAIPARPHKYHSDSIVMMALGRCVKQLASPRDNEHRLRELVLVVWEERWIDGFDERDYFAEWLAESIFGALAEHQSCWNSVRLSYHEGSHTQGSRWERQSRLLYGAGRIHTKDASGAWPWDLANAMRRTKRAYPLRMLQQELEQFLYRWILTRQSASVASWCLRASRDAVHRDDEGEFYEYMDLAINHAIRERQRVHFVSLLYGSYHEKILEDCMHQGRQLLSAKEGGWRPCYRIKSS
jgi:hypothetical protein